MSIALTNMYLSLSLLHFFEFVLRDVPNCLIPDHIISGSPDVTRSWLLVSVSQIVDIFIMFGDITDIATGVSNMSRGQPLPRKHLPCRMPGCSFSFTHREKQGRTIREKTREQGRKHSWLGSGFSARCNQEFNHYANSVAKCLVCCKTFCNKLFTPM